MVLQLYADLCGDGSHSHQDGTHQGMGCACFVNVRIIETDSFYVDEQGQPYEPVHEILDEDYQEFRMSHREVCTAAVPEFMAIILSIYHGIKMIQKAQAKWKLASASIFINIYSDSQNVINYIRGPGEGHLMQVPWLAVMMGMTRAMLDHYDNWQLKYKIERMPRSDPIMFDCNKDAIEHRDKHLPNVNVDPWIEGELNCAVSQCARIKRILNEDRFHSTKAGIKNTNWVFIPQRITVPVENLIINRNTCFHSLQGETFADWYWRQGFDSNQVFS